MFGQILDLGGSHYGSEYSRQLAAGILLVESIHIAARILLFANHSLSDQNALDLSAELDERFDNKNWFASNTIAWKVVQNQKIALSYISSDFALTRLIGLLIIIPSFP